MTNIITQLCEKYLWPKAQPELVPLFENDGAFVESNR